MKLLKIQNQFVSHMQLEKASLIKQFLQILKKQKYA